MAEKKEGFGQAATQAVSGGGGKESPILFSTPNYRVVIGRIPPTEQHPQAESPLLVRYIIQHIKQGVVYGHSSGLGQAIAAAVQAEIELTNATAAAEEFGARNYKPDEGKADGVVPRFGRN